MLTFRCFLTLSQFTHLIIMRLRHSFASTTPYHQQSRVRTFVVIRHWLQAFWEVDFEGNEELVKSLVTGLDECWKGAKELQSGDKQLLLKLRHLLSQESIVIFISQRTNHFYRSIVSVTERQPRQQLQSLQQHSPKLQNHQPF
jgi:hypothetical protein